MNQRPENHACVLLMPPTPLHFWYGFCFLLMLIGLVIALMYG